MRLDVGGMGFCRHLRRRGFLLAGVGPITASAATATAAAAAFAFTAFARGAAVGFSRRAAGLCRCVGAKLRAFASLDLLGCAFDAALVAVTPAAPATAPGAVALRGGCCRMCTA